MPLTHATPVARCIDHPLTEYEYLTSDYRPGDSHALSFALPDAKFALVNATGATVIYEGTYELAFDDGTTTVNATRTVTQGQVVRMVPLPPSDLPHAGPDRG